MKTKIFLAIVLIGAVIAVAFGQSNKTNNAQLPDEIKKLETLATSGDTVAMHQLLRFYDDNSPVYLEVEEIIEVEAEEEYIDSVVVVDEGLECDSVAPISDEMAALYAARLDYWLTRGIEMNDPVATYIKGMRLYYTDEAEALKYLSKAAEMGYSRAALFCGSALFNQGRGQEAIKYLTIADKLGEQSAGWHLAMCYIGNVGVKEDVDKAIHYLVKSALNDYPEAVLEMKRINPENPLWQHKIDSLRIDFPDFPIILTE